MYYVMNDNVYLVKGRRRSCIYDLSNNKLYSINNKLSFQIEKINEGKRIVGDIDRQEKNIFDKLIKFGILKISCQEEPRYIDEIKKRGNNCQFAWIEITNMCNLQCIHCYNESDIRCTKSMTMEEFKLVIKRIIELGVKRIQIIGGEPFFKKDDLRKMLDYAVGKFNYIEIFTNGTLIPLEWFAYLKKTKIHIALSVYSYLPEMHEKVTGCKGSFVKTNDTIKHLKEYGIPYRVCNVLMKNIELGDAENGLYKLRKDKDIVRMSGRANFRLLSEELIRKRLITKETFKTPITKAFCSRLVSGHNCFKDRIYISADLKIYPCVMERRILHGVISSNQPIILNDNIRNLTKDNINECFCCEYRFACFDCRPNSLCNDIKEKPWYCTYQPLKGTWCDIDSFICKLKKEYCSE